MTLDTSLLAVGRSTDEPSQRARLAGIAPIVLGGTIVGVVAVAHSLQRADTTLAVSLSVLVLLGVTAPSYLVGGYLYRAGYAPASLARILAWSLLGGIPLAVLTLVLSAYQAALGSPVQELPFVVALVSGIGLIGGAFTGIHDVERSKRESAFTTIDLRFRALIEAAPVAVVGVDRTGRVELWNAAATEVFGYEADAVVGSPIPVRPLDDDDDETVDNCWFEDHRSPREFACERADGSRIVVECRTAAIAGDEGTDQGYISIVSDVTERNRREQRLAVLHRVLRHNLRTSITVLDGHASLLANPEDTVLDPADSLEAITETTRELQHLSEKAGVIERTLQHQAERRPRDVTALVERHVAAAHEQHPEAAIELDATATAWARVGTGFGTALDEAIWNAVEHHDDSNPTIEVDVCVDEDAVCVSVLDDGPGIPPAERTAIERGEETQMQHVTGLGLWLMHWALTGDGGSVTFGENDPRGTEVVFTLPASGPPTETVSAEAAEPETPGPGSLAPHAEPTATSSGSGTLD